MKHVNLFLLISFAFLLLTACSSDEVGTSRINVRLTDSPGDYDEVNVDIQKVMVHSSSDAGEGDNGWQELEEINAGVYNLLELTNGLDTLLATAELPSGRISQIRLVLGNNNTLVVNGESHDLDTPSAQQSGLKLNLQQELAAGITYTILLDFDAARSIVERGNGTYGLKPVIRVVAEATSGAISGIVEPAASSPAVYAIAGEDSVGTFANEAGEFLIKGLEAGSYRVVFVPTAAYSETSVDNVSVSIGEVSNVGTVTITE